MDKNKHLDIKNLPSLRYYTPLMRFLYFEFIVSFIKKKNIYGVSKWVNNFEKRLSDYLNVTKKINKGKLHPKICRDINYILDIITHGIYKLRGTNYVKLAHDIEITAKKLLDRDGPLGCIRKIHNITGNDIIYRKYMDDICIDIPYIKEKMKEIKQSNNCQKIVSYFEGKRKIFLDNCQHIPNNEFFNFDNVCTINKIKNELETLNCNALDEAKAQSLVEAPADAPVEPGTGELMETTLEEAQAAQKLENLLQQGLQEETPNLDTTYAAASLTGVSLFGVLLYKYTNLGSWLNSRNGSNRGMNRFPINGELNEDLLMNNFEYLQTGVPNQEYHLAYNSMPN
ncbi:PIR protein [Plasmodium vivax]|uniref:VIR protein n=1 Tax=Plasmodium vivax TaxID=5855 RepID=A0A565A3R6_PLAVI|nr:PIR protein [Plasmodium vivax]